MQFYQRVILIMNFKLINIICVPQNSDKGSKEMSDQISDIHRIHLVQFPNDIETHYDQHKSYGIFIPYAPSVKPTDIQVVPIVHNKDGFIIPIGSLRLPRTHIFDNINIPITPNIVDIDGLKKIPVIKLEENKNQYADVPGSTTMSDREILIQFINRFRPDLSDKYIEDKAFDRDNYKNSKDGVNLWQSTVEYFQLNTPKYQENNGLEDSYIVTTPYENQSNYKQTMEPNIENNIPHGFVTSFSSPKYDYKNKDEANSVLQAVIRNITKNHNYLADLRKFSELNAYRRQQSMRNNFPVFRPEYTNKLKIPIEIVPKQKHIFFNRQNSSVNLFRNLPLNSSVKPATPPSNDTRNPQESDPFKKFMTNFLHHNLQGTGSRNAAVHKQRKMPVAWCGCYRGCDDPIPKWKYTDYRKPFWRQLSLSAIYRCKFRKWIHDNSWFLKEMFKSIRNKTKFNKNIATRRPDVLPNKIESQHSTEKSLNVEVQTPSYVQLYPIKIKAMSDSPLPGPNQGKLVPIYRSGDDRSQRGLRGWAKASGGRIPLGAFSAGKNKDGKTVYIARALYNDGKEHGLVPGMIVDDDRCVRFNWRGQEICQTDYEVLVGAEFSWVVSHVKDFHPDRLVAGYEYDASRFLLICRKTILKSVVVTKLSASDGKCYASSAATQSVEYGFSEYELLIE